MTAATLLPFPSGTARDPLVDVRRGDRWLVVVAHPDDEAFACGSVIARATSAGARVVLACATRGEAGQPAPGLPDCADLGAVREAELYRSAAALGVAAVELLGYRDSGFGGEPPRGSLCAAAPDDVAGVLARLVAGVRPDVVLVLDGTDGHRDHQRIRTATAAAVRNAAAPGTVLVEHCLPNSLMRRWLEEMRPVRPDAAYHAIDPSDFGRPDAEVTDVLDVSGFLDRREAAMAEHRSQATPFDGLSADLRHAFLATDHLARVAWQPRRPGTWWDPDRAGWAPCPRRS